MEITPNAVSYKLFADTEPGPLCVVTRNKTFLVAAAESVLIYDAVFLYF